MPSILVDSKADILVYGMGEKQIVEIAKAIDRCAEDGRSLRLKMKDRCAEDGRSLRLKMEDRCAEDGRSLRLKMEDCCAEVGRYGLA